MEVEKLPIMAKFDVATGLLSGSNRANMSKSHEKMGKLAVFQVFDIVLLIFLFTFGPQKIGLKTLPLMGEFDVATDLPSEANRAEMSQSHGNRPFLPRNRRFSF